MLQLGKIGEELLLLKKYGKVVIKTWFQYKVDAILRSLAVFLRESASIIIIYITFQNFDNINGWNMNELFFLFSFIFVSYGILILLFTGLRDFDYLIHTGELDRFLLRPKGILYQVMVWDADYFAAIGHGTLGMLLFIGTANKIGIIWNLINILYCILTIMGGVLIQGSVLLTIAALSFYFVKTSNVRDLLFYNAKKLSQYPVSIYPKILQYFLIFIVPFAFVNYFPSQYFLEKKDEIISGQILIYLTPLVGILLFYMSTLFWNYSLKKYSSTGN